MSNFSNELTRPVVWLAKHETLPDTCIVCGMFTDNLIATKFSEKQHQNVMKPAGSSAVDGLGCLLHLLGPIGIIVSLLLSKKEEPEMVQKAVRVKAKVKIPCCRLCGGQTPPAPIEIDQASDKFAFEVHMTFAERLRMIRQDASRMS